MASVIKSDTIEATYACVPQGSSLLLTPLLLFDTRTPLVDISNRHLCFLIPFTLYSYY